MQNNKMAAHANIANDIAVINGTSYYWKVITKYSKGNSSASEIFNLSN